MASLLLLVEVHVIPQFELVLSCVQTTSQSPVTQLTKPKMFFETSKWTHQKLVSRSTLQNEFLARWTLFSDETNYNDKRRYSRNLQSTSLSWRLSWNAFKCDSEKNCRAWFAISKLRPIFISQICETIVAYGLESVPMTPSLCRQIDASHRHIVRAA